MAKASHGKPPRPARKTSRRKRPAPPAAADAAPVPPAAAAERLPAPAIASKAALAAELARARAGLRELNRLRAAVAELETYREEATRQQHELFLTQQALEDSRDRYAALYDLAPVVYMTLSRYGVIQEMNLTGAALLRGERSRLLGTPLLVFVDAASRMTFLQHMQRCRAGEPVVTSELNLLPRNGPLLPVQLTSKSVSDPGRYGGPGPFATVVLDLTERRAAEQREEAYRLRLRAMASELSLIEERERRRIATALHDNLAQVLALARIKLGTARKKQPDSKELEQIGDLVTEALRQARSLTLELSPPVLYQFGLEAAIEWLGEQLRGHGLGVRVQSDGRARTLPEDLNVLLFQAVRELLTNVVKHAGAKSAVVSIATVGHNVEVVVQDDGVGFRSLSGGADRAGNTSGGATGSGGGGGDRSGTEDGGGFGLFNLRARVEHLGGRFEVESTAGAGAHVLISVPIYPGPPGRQQPQQPQQRPGPRSGNGQPSPARRSRDRRPRETLSDGDCTHAEQHNQHPAGGRPQDRA